MIESNRTWALLARKFAGEINDEELYELDTMLLNDYEMNCTARLLQDIWKHDEKAIQDPRDNESLKKIMRKIRIINS